MQKRIFSNKFFYLTVVIFVSLVWLGRSYFSDEIPAEGREEFYQNSNRHVSDERNLAIAISGLKAPVGENVIVYGRKVVDSHQLSANNKQSKEDPNKINELQIVWPEDRQFIDCGRENVIELIDGECISIEDANELIEQNHVLLNRYFELYQIPDWHGDSYEENALTLTLNTLLSVKNKLLIHQENSEVAYQQWKKNHSFILHTLKQELPFISQTSFQIAYGISLETLEHITYESPEILLTHDAELSNLLKQQDLTNNLKNMLRADYALFNRMLSNFQNAAKTIRIERMRNRLYYFHHDYLELTKLSAKESIKHYSELVNKHKAQSSSRFFTFIKNFLPYGVTDNLFNVMIMGNMMAFDGVIDEMHTNNAMNNLINLRNQIKLQNVQETDIRTFLKSSSKELYCPYTEKPMAFDKRSKILYCVHPKNSERTMEVRLIL